MRINTEFSTIYISEELQKILDKVLEEFQKTKVFILVDENTRKYCLPRIQNHTIIQSAEIIEIKSGENNKCIQSLEKIWNILTNKNANRSSLLINLGGGLIGDLGGFAASTFKRGMNFINIPTTLLSQVDASIGGKTGINFQGLKNEIGVFNHPQYVIIDSSFNRTLDKRNIMSGWAEMLKHALIFSEEDWKNLIAHDIKQTGFKELNQLIARSVNIKNHFVEQDPKEKNIRKALNFGHTFGHAFESLLMNTKNEILHGEAVAHGMICEIYLSHKICELSKLHLNEMVEYLLSTFGKLDIKEELFEQIFDLMTHDKKNEGGKINFTLLKNIGKIEINQNCRKENIMETLNWYMNL